MTTTPLAPLEAPPAVAVASPPSRRAWPVVVALVLAVVSSAELGARALARHLPVPLAWNQREAGLIVEQMKRVAAEEGGAEVVFLGSSVANFAFEPDVWRDTTGRSAYNAALPGSSIVSIERWAEEMVVPLLQPKTLVLGVTTRDVNDNGAPQRDNLRQYLTSPERKRMLGIESAAERAERFVSEHSAIVRLRPYLRRPAAVVKQLRGRDALERMIAFGPHGEPRFPEADFAFGDTPARRQWDVEALDGFAFEHNMQAIVRLARWARARGIELVVVDMPVVAPLYASYHPHGGADLEGYRAALRDAVRTAGARLVEMPPGFQGEDLHVDSIHLNRVGARRFTREVATAR